MSESTSHMDGKSMIDLVSKIFGELNIGMLIYHVEDDADPASLRLMYANRAASGYTGSDLSDRIGKTILEAFPALEGTDLPAEFLAVASGGKSRNFGSFEYPGDHSIGQSHYSVKAFPMPDLCVGVAFENISVRKKLDALVNKKK